MTEQSSTSNQIPAIENFSCCNLNQKSMKRACETNSRDISSSRTNFNESSLASFNESPTLKSIPNMKMENTQKEPLDQTSANKNLLKYKIVTKTINPIASYNVQYKNLTNSESKSLDEIDIAKYSDKMYFCIYLGMKNVIILTIPQYPQL